MGKTLILDTNAILRHLLNDLPEQADIVEEKILNNDILIVPEVLAEVVYVLLKVYQYTRKEVSKFIQTFLQDVQCKDKLIINAVRTFSTENIDFVDCMILQYHRQGIYEVFTFDKKLLKLINKK
jgi:predicted nucleic-acid-binding protein